MFHYVCMALGEISMSKIFINVSKFHSKVQLEIVLKLLKFYEYFINIRKIKNLNIFYDIKKKTIKIKIYPCINFKKTLDRR